MAEIDTILRRQVHISDTASSISSSNLINLIVGDFRERMFVAARYAVGRDSVGHVRQARSRKQVGFIDAAADVTHVPTVFSGPQIAPQLYFQNKGVCRTGPTLPMGSAIPVLEIMAQADQTVPYRNRSGDFPCDDLCLAHAVGTIRTLLSCMLRGSHRRFLHWLPLVSGGGGGHRLYPAPSIAQEAAA